MVFYLLVAGYWLVLWPFAFFSAMYGVKHPGETDAAFRTSAPVHYVTSAPLYLGAMVLLGLLFAVPMKRRWPWALFILLGVASVVLYRWYLVSHYPLWPVSG
ncbi:MAG: hypothetical protein KDE22_11030 [Rhodobacterales bacterium]|nr:hypothetical protein [Rhodobacterales bacterium]